MKKKSLSKTVLLFLLSLNLYSYELTKSNIYLAPKTSVEDLFDQKIFNSKYILSAQHIGEYETVKKIGEKAYTLSTLFKNGAPVAPLFSITNETFADFRNQTVPGSNGSLCKQIKMITDQLTSLSTHIEIEIAEQKIESIIINTPIQNEFKEQLSHALMYLHKKFGIDYFSVRSSSISLSEDSITNSLPGLFETELNKTGVDSILNSIKRVWISQWSKSALTYRLNNNISLDNVDMGVIIQEQLNSIISGVFYTQAIGTNPLDKNIISELTAGRGLGKSVVEGKITPDWFKIDRYGQVTDKRLGNQSSFFARKKEGGIEEVSFNNHNIFLLSEDKLKELNFEVNKWILKLEEVTKKISPFGYDVEWAISEEGKIYIFQARPIPIPKNDPLKYLYLSLSKLSETREDLLTVLKVLSNEKIYSGSLEQIIENIAAMQKRVQKDSDLTQDFEVIIQLIKNKLFLETDFSSIIEFMESNYAMFQKISSNELGDNAKLHSLFDCYLYAVEQGRIPSEEFNSLRMLKFKMYQIEEKVSIPNFKTVYNSMLLNLKFHNFYPTLLQVYFDNYSLFKEEQFQKKSGELIEKIVISWEAIDSISCSDILDIFDVLWNEYFREKTESHDVFLKGIKTLFTNINPNTKTLTKIKKINQNLILFPLILQSKFPELKGKISDSEVEEWMINIKSDPRFLNSISFDSFISYSIDLLFLNSLYLSESIEKIASSFGIKKKTLNTIIHFILNQDIDINTLEQQEFLKDKFSLTLKSGQFSDFISKLNLLQLTSQHTASILESEDFLSSLTLFELKDLVSYIFYQSDNPLLKERIINGIKNLIASEKGIRSPFFKQIIDELMICDLSKSKISLKFLQKFKLYNKDKEKISNSFVNLSILTSDFKSLGEQILSNKESIQSNPFDLKDAIEFAINAAKTKNEKHLKLALIAIKNIFRNKGFHGNVWRDGYDDKVRPENPNLMNQRELSLIIGSTGEDILDMMYDSYKNIHIDVRDHFQMIRDPFDELLSLLEKDEYENLLLSYYYNFIEFFNLPSKQGIDVDHYVSILNDEVLEASKYSTRRKIREAKRYFIEKASRYIPGSMDIGVDWREMHDDFENLHEYVQSQSDSLSRSLHLLRNDIHNVLDHKVLDQARLVLKIVNDESNKLSFPNISNLKTKLTRLVYLLEKLYKPITEVGKDISSLIKIIPADLETKINSIIKSQIAVSLNNTLNITDFSSIKHNLIKAENYIKEKKYFDSLIEITSIRGVINILLNDDNINRRSVLLSAIDRLALIKLDISLESLESGIVSRIAEESEFRFKDAVNSINWLYNIFNICSNHFENSADIKKMIINLINQLELKNIIASAEIWSTIRKEISNLENRRTILSFRLFEFAAQKLDAYFFEDSIIPISPGHASGRARIFQYESEQELSRLINDKENGLRQTEILVIRDIPRVIDISLEHIPSGIIIEEGSIGSHTSCAVRQGEKPIPTILVKDALKYIKENDLLGFQVSSDMKEVELKTANLHLIEVTNKLKDSPQRIAPGWAEGIIKIVKSDDGDLAKGWKQANISRKDIVVLESFDGSNDIYHMITSYGIPAGIIVSKGSTLSNFRKILRRIVDQNKIEIPIIRVNDAVSVFSPSNGNYYAMSVRKNIIKLFKRVEKTLKLEDVKKSSKTINSLTKKDLIINPRIVISDIEGNNLTFMKKKEYLTAMYPRHPLLYLGNVIGKNKGSIDILEYIFDSINSGGKDTLLLGQNEILFLNCMNGDLNDLKLFISNVGIGLFKEAGIDFPDNQNDINQKFHNAIKNNYQLNNIYNLLREHGKLYYVENDHAFFANEFLLDKSSDIIGYQLENGFILKNRDAFDKMEDDLKNNPDYLLKQILDGKSPISLIKNEKFNLKEHEVDKLAITFQVKSFVLSKKTDKILENIISVSKGCLLFFNKVGIRWLNENKHLVKDIYVVEAPLKTLHSSFIPGVDLNIRHAVSINEIKEIKGIFSTSGISNKKIPMDARYIVAIDSLSLKIIGGLWYQVNNKIAVVGDVVTVSEVSKTNIKKYLVASMLNQLLYDKIESISLLGNKNSIDFIEDVLSEIVIDDGIGEQKVFHLISSSIRRKALLKIRPVSQPHFFNDTIKIKLLKSA